MFALPTEFAVIDLGSNTVRLSIFSCHAPASINQLYQSSERLRLIETLDEQGNLPEYAIQKVVQTMQGFKGWCVSAKVPHVAIVATSAVREAENQHVLCEHISRATGLHTRVLSVGWGQKA
ncbi:MAG: hypothetical protein KIH69_013815 [Anaerolineae bacterium]|nr:hypothetical protein [Anaerolineae bacterium]